MMLLRVNNQPQNPGGNPSPRSFGMYQGFFELTRIPFRSTPDSQGYFASPFHNQALRLMQGCISQGDGIGLVLGPTGSGKTLLCRLLLENLQSHHCAAFLTNTHLESVPSMLQAILYDLSIPYEGITEQEMRLRLTSFLMDRFSEGGRTVLFVDEAQNLSTTQLEELRLLTNLEGRSERAIQILLFAHARMLGLLRLPEMEPFRQRVSAKAMLRRFEIEETIDYIRHLMAIAGGSADSILTTGALCEIHDRADGLPRRINQLCHRTLLHAFTQEVGLVDVAEVQQAAGQLLFGDEPEEPTTSKTYRTSSIHEESEIDSDRETVLESGDAPAQVEVGAHQGESIHQAETVDDEELDSPSVVEVGAGCPPLSYSTIETEVYVPTDSDESDDMFEVLEEEPEPDPTIEIITDEPIPHHPAGVSRLYQMYSR